MPSSILGISRRSTRLLSQLLPYKLSKLRRASHLLGLMVILLLPSKPLLAQLVQGNGPAISPATDAVGQSRSTAAPDPVAKPSGATSLIGQLPLRFEPARDGSGMISLSNNRSLRVRPGGLVDMEAPFEGGTADIRLELKGSSPLASVTGAHALPGHSNYFLGNERLQWRTGVQQFGQARVDGVYPGIDLVYYGNGKTLEHDFRVTPSGNPEQIRFQIDGGDAHVEANSGDLIIHRSHSGPEMVRLHRPVAYQESSDGSRKAVPALYRQNRDGSFSFNLGRYDHARTLVIDPVITYSTYFGGSKDDGVADVKLDAAGNIYLLVQASSVDLPVVSQIPGACAGACGPANPGVNIYFQSIYDMFLAKLDPTGQKLLYSTYIGGSKSDIPGSLAIATDGTIYISGETKSADFPVVNGYSAKLAPNPNGGQPETSTLTRISADGSQILYSTLIGGGFTSQLSTGGEIGYGPPGGKRAYECARHRRSWSQWHRLPARSGGYGRPRSHR